jgi:hypothetical protein
VGGAVPYSQQAFFLPSSEAGLQAVQSREAEVLRAIQCVAAAGGAKAGNVAKTQQERQEEPPALRR